MKSYSMSEDLLDVTTAEATKEWTQKNTKAELALKSSISLSVFEHVLSCAYTNLYLARIRSIGEQEK